MNMAFVMPAADKTADSVRAAGKREAVKKNGPVSEEMELFSELLLLLSASRNDMAMQQSSRDSLPLSGFNHGRDFQKGQTMPLESLSLAEHVHDLFQCMEGDPAAIEPADGDIHSSGIGVYLPAMEKTEGGSPDRESFLENLNKHGEAAEDKTTNVVPEMIPDLLPEVRAVNISEAGRPHFNTGSGGILSQLSRKLVDMYHIGGHTARIRLQPEELGHMNIDISVVDNSIKAIVTVEENCVKDVLEANIDILVQELKGSGLNIDQFTVKTMSSYDDGNMTGWWADGGRREMFSDRIFNRQTEHDDVIPPDGVNGIIYAGSGTVSIFV